MTKPDLAARVAQRADAEPDPDGSPAIVTAADAVDLAQNDTLLRWLNERRSYFAAALPKHINENQFVQAALTAMYQNPALQKCSPESLMLALMQCAKLGLDPDGVHAAIVPYGKAAKFVPMYMGYIELMYRSGMVESVVFDHVRDSDRWRYNQALRPPDDFEHEPNLLTRHQGRPILAYAFAWLKGGARSQIMFLNREEAEQLRDERSKAYQNAERSRRENAEHFAKNPGWGRYSSTWHTDFDAMWLKSPVRRLAKRVPTSPEIRELLKVDNEIDLMERLAVPVGVLPPETRPEIESADRRDEVIWPEVAKPGSGAEGAPGGES